MELDSTKMRAASRIDALCFALSTCIVVSLWCNIEASALPAPEGHPKDIDKSRKSLGFEVVPFMGTVVSQYLYENGEFNLQEKEEETEEEGTNTKNMEGVIADDKAGITKASIYLKERKKVIRMDEQNENEDENEIARVKVVRVVNNKH